MKIEWEGDWWELKYYETGYARYVLEQAGISFSWLQNEKQSFKSEKEFIKFLREKEKT